MPGDDNPLLGSWHLQRWDITYGDGRRPTYPYGEDATGLLVYTPDGWMSACICRSNRPKLSSESTRSAPAAEQVAAFGSYFHYAGPYTLRTVPNPNKDIAPQRQVVHRVTHSINPNFVGSEQVRNMDFSSNGLLTLSATDTVPGTTVARHHRLVWARQHGQP